MPVLELVGGTTQDGSSLVVIDRYVPVFSVPRRSGNYWDGQKFWSDDYAVFPMRFTRGESCFEVLVGVLRGVREKDARDEVCRRLNELFGGSSKGGS